MDACMAAPAASSAPPAPPPLTCPEDPAPPRGQGGALDIDLPQGLPGLREVRRIRVEPLATAPGFYELQAPEQGLRLVAWAFAPGVVPLAEADLAEACRSAGLPGPDALVLIVAAIHDTDDGREITLNLRAPLLVDCRRRTGLQQVLPTPAYPTRHRLCLLDP